MFEPLAPGGGEGRVRGSPEASRSSLVREVGEERRAQIAFAEGRDDDHDELARALRPARDFDGGPEGRAGGDADEEAFFARGAAGPGEGRGVLYPADLVLDLGV